jgi:hypothetical protein
VTLEQIYVRVEVAFDALYAVRGNLDGSIRLDTALALGEALGVVERAKALVERDLDGEGDAGRAGDDAAREHGEDASGAG